MTLSPIASALAAANAGNGFACYGDASAEPIGDKLARSYLAARQAGDGASLALAKARRKVAAGDKRAWPSHARPHGASVRQASGLTFLESPESYGFRFVGYADELAGLRNRGYYLDSDGDGQVARGGVWRLSAKRGRARYVAGLVTGESLRRGWQDNGGASLDLTGRCIRVATESGGEDSEGADLAHTADSLAENYAEEAREYDSAWRTGQRAAELVAEAEAERESARELLAELRGKAADDMPAICRTLRATVSAHLAAARKRYAEARKLWEESGELFKPAAWQIAYAESRGARIGDPGYWDGAEHNRLALAFRDGASAASYWESRK